MFKYVEKSVTLLKTRGWEDTSYCLINSMQNILTKNDEMQICCQLGLCVNLTCKN